MSYMTAESNIEALPVRRYAASKDVPRPTRIAVQIREVLKLAQEFEAQLGSALGCNPTDLAAMRHLIESGPMTPTELAARLGVSTAAATMVVDRLGALGHASRAPHETDRRKVVIVPAEASIEAAVAELMPFFVGVAELVAKLGDGDRRVVEAFLDGLLEVYRGVVTASKP